MMLKAVASNIAPYATKPSGCFPVLWKMSHVVPIPISIDRTRPNHFLSKLLRGTLHIAV